MNQLEKEICKNAIGHIRLLTGKGPKNIHTKIMNDSIQIHFWLMKSPIEEYVINEIDNGEQIVTYLYKYAVQQRLRILETECIELLQRSVFFKDLSIDLHNDKYVAHFDLGEQQRRV